MYTGPNIPTNGLVLSLDAANTKSYVSGSAIWRDLSGTSISSSLLNEPGYDSSYGGFLTFDGTSDATVISSFTMPLNSASIEIWVFPLTTGATYGSIFSFRNYQFTVAFILGIDGGFGFVTFDTEYREVYSRNSNEFIGKWNQVVITYNNNGLGYDKQIYCNGSFRNSNTVTNINQAGLNGNVGIGSSAFIAAYANNKIATTKIYNRVLSASEILQLYNSQKSRFNL